MPDQSLIGSVLSTVTVEVAPKEVRRFVDTIGEPNPIYRDRTAALAAGFPGIPLPPTFGFTLMLDRPEPFGFLSVLGIDIRKMLHAEQRFDYHAPLVAGEPITLVDRVGDRYEKKGGKLEFWALDTEARRADGTLALTMRRTMVVVHG